VAVEPPRGRARHALPLVLFAAIAIFYALSASFFGRDDAAARS
jgi:hypothetical protein